MMFSLSILPMSLQVVLAVAALSLINLVQSDPVFPAVTCPAEVVCDGLRNVLNQGRGYNWTHDWERDTVVNDMANAIAAQHPDPAAPDLGDMSKPARCWIYRVMSACIEKFNTECASEHERANPVRPYLSTRLPVMIQANCV